MKLPVIFLITVVLAALTAAGLYLERSKVRQAIPEAVVDQVRPLVSKSEQKPLPTKEDVPFTAQAPLAEWKDPHQQDGCEEASALMAMHWVKSEKITSKQAAKEEILAISKFQEDKFGSYRDTSAADTAKRIIEGFYNYTNYEIKPVNTVEDLVRQLDAGNLIVVPANGQVLGNKNFTQPGPERHMFVIKGYDRKNLQFITNETGIRQGENWRYDENVLFNSLRDYPTGFHVPITENKKVMIVVRKS